jgi:hypothetical protein
MYILKKNYRQIMYLKHLLILVLFLFFSACSSDSNSSAPAKVTGLFIDDAVEGLSYSCSSGLTGLTDADGKYTCNAGDDVSFLLNGVTIGSSVSAQTGAVTPYSLFPNNHDASLNLARLLQSINTVNNTNNDTIKINTLLESKIPANIDFTNASFETIIETELGITLKDSHEAQAAMNSSILANGGTVPEDLNHIPVADAGVDQNVISSFVVNLNGLGSLDADSDMLSYSWTLVTKPASSTTTLVNPNVANPSFVPDIDGDYIIELVVNDGISNSSANSVKVTAKTSSSAPILMNSTATVSEDLTAGGTVGSVTISSSGSNPITAITLNGEGSANFSVSVIGAITLNSGSSLNYSTIPEYNLSAVATSLAGNSSSVSVNISVTQSSTVDTPSVVAVLANSTATVLENSSAGTLVGNVSIVSSGDSNITAITLSGDGSTNFSVSTSGVISVASAALLDYETATSYTLSAIATNTAGDSNSVSVIITLSDVVEGNAPILANSTGSVSENAATGATVGNVTISSIGDSAISSITLSGVGSTNFSVSTSGAISVKAGATLDYETNQTYNLTAIATNSQGNSTAVSVTISVLNVTETPVLVASTGSIAEDANTGATLGSITITATGDSPISAITLTGTGNTNFEVSTDGVVTLKTGAILDYETAQSYSLNAYATNSAGNSSSVGFSVTIEDVLDTATFYIKSAVYENNATATPADDKLYVYFNQAIDSASVDANMSANYTITGTGAISSASTSAYVDTNFHQHTISLEATSTALVPNSTRVSISPDILRDVLGHPTIYDANLSVVEKFRVLAKTQQTISYPTTTATDRDDGFYESGQVRSYTDNGDGTITDNLTGLIWQQEDDNTTRNFENASTYCSDLTIATKSNFRVPTIEELLTLNHYNTTNPSIDAVFTNTYPYHYWSNTTFSNDTLSAHTVNFSNAELSILPKNSGIHVRCVQTGL